MMVNFFYNRKQQYNKSKREKYRTDPEYRKMHIEASTRWQKRNRIGCQYL